MLDMAEQALKRNMDELRQEVGKVVKDTQQRVEEAIWQLVCAADASAPPKHSHSAALDVVAAVAVRAAQDAAGAAPPPSKSNADAIKTLRVGVCLVLTGDLCYLERGHLDAQADSL